MSRLSISEYSRYSRQLILPAIGLPGQNSLKSTKVLVIGAGGLGCPALLYLTSSGFGTIGIVDGDDVEISNLHRQIIHTTPGKNKVASAVEYLQQLNPHVEFKKYPFYLTPENGRDIISKYDLVLDCTDRPFTRYLISDICRMSNIGLISGAAIRSDGQLLVLTDTTGPCYRCIFPVEPVVFERCGDVGVVPAVVGTIGTMMALEAMQYVVQGPKTRFVIWDGQEWRVVKLRSRKKDCLACNGSICIERKEHLCENIQIPKEWRVTWEDMLQHTRDSISISKGTIVDIRSETEFGICNIEESVNIPLEQIQDTKWNGNTLNQPLYIVCHHGNDSQRAVSLLRTRGIECVDIKGGLDALADIFPHFPRY